MSLRSEVVRIFNELIAGSKKISQLPAADTLVGPELMEIVQGGVNKKATASQFGGGATEFTQLTDVPATYVGSAGLTVTVNGAENGLEFTSGGGGGTWGSITGTLADQTDLQSALFLKANKLDTFNIQPGDYVLVLADAETKCIVMDVGTSNTVTIPPNSSVAFSVGTIITIAQYDIGQTAMVAGGGVTIRSSSGVLTSPGQYSPMVIEKLDTDEWFLWNGVSQTPGQALTRVNDTNVTAVLSGTPATALLAAVEITLGWTGLLSVARGGIGVALGTAQQGLKVNSAATALEYYATSGTYTPTLTNVANVDASTAYLCTYMRSGNTVTVSGHFDIDPTTTLTSTQLGISLPVASAFTTANQCGGTAAAIGIAGQSAAIRSDATNDRAEVIFMAADVTNQAMYFSFTYQVL